MYEDIKKEMKKYSNSKRKKTNEYFFKTGKGQYGEGDIFMGVRTPDLRKIAKQFSHILKKDLKKLISSEIHEERFLALVILVNSFKQFSKKKDIEKQKEILDFYLNNKMFINNWDLIDVSVHYILGQAILDGIQNKKILYKLAISKNLWERRMAIVSTWIFIRKNKYNDVLKIGKILLDDKEDLIHKAIGWMLREVWKKDFKKIEGFLKENYKKIPRTTLRYAIERMEEKKRKRFLKGKF